MNKITTIEEGVAKLEKELTERTVKEYKYIPAKENMLADILVCDGEEIPVFWWRYDNQVFPLESSERNIDSVSCKLNTITTKKNGLDRLMIRQFDIAEWYLKSKVERLNCYQKGASAEVLLTMQNKKVAILEMAATLHENAFEQGRFTIWGRKGMASNRVVSQKEMPQSIYVYGDNGETEVYNDLVLQLYGLSREDVIKTCAIISMLKWDCDFDKTKKDFERYKKYLSLAKKSAKENRPCIIKEEN